MMYQAHQVPPQTPEFDHQSAIKLERLQSHLKKALHHIKAQQVEIAALRHAIAEKDRQLTAQTSINRTPSFKRNAKYQKQYARALDIIGGMNSGENLPVRAFAASINAGTDRARALITELVDEKRLVRWGKNKDRVRVA